MKKLIMAAAFVAIGTASFAQKPAAGNVTAEVQLNFQIGDAPITVNPKSINSGTPALAARYFLSDDLALRLKLGIGSSSTTTDVNEPAPGTGTGSVEISNSGFGIGVGIEKHFAGTTRLSPFIGAELAFNTNSNSETYVNANDGITGDPVFELGRLRSEEGSSSTFGVNIFGGADYYFVDNVYLGVEVGWGFASTSNGDTDITSSDAINPTPVSTSTPGASSSQLRVFTNSGLRLGFVF